jgi:hypothetical protein
MSVEEIKKLAEDLKDKREKKKALEEELDVLSTEIKVIEEHTLNDLLLDSGLANLTVDDLVIKRSEVYRGKTTSEEKSDFDYLFDSNNGGAVKQEIIINIGDNACDEEDVTALLSKAGIDYKKKYSIHHGTLSSIIRLLLEEGVLSSEDLVENCIYIQPKIAVKPVKK